ncbi:hypothetical protein BDN72DRAFT_964752 [Pluteus cervinus]|uniref:Uncharacterized protein n=1 Tax=Pluteus cervinus TaxID=181527 RepID=A0ACD3ABA5_9AGAR|nr:hypothetical protein BDN72DRAFT_964752 [Pluteus cervinus]
MTSFPIEILSLILHSLRPTFSPAASRSKRTSLAGELRPHSLKQYSQSLAICAQLRLVDRSFYHILTPHLYSLLVIPARSQIQQKRCRATEHHPEMIQTILFNGIFDAYVPSERKSEVFAHLKKVLGRCTNLTHIKVDLIEHSAWAIDKTMAEVLFKDLPTKSLTSLEIWNPGVEVFAGLVEGLGRELVGGLKVLAMHGVNVDMVQRPTGQCSNAFEGLEQVHIMQVPFSGRPQSFLHFMACILDVKNTEVPHLGLASQATHPDALPTRTNQTVPHHSRLRELTISEGPLFVNMDNNLTLFRQLLSIRNVHESLTTLRVRLRPPRLNPGHDIPLPQFNTLPSSILELCPRVTHFHFLTWFPVPFLLNIPARIVELGVRIAEDMNNPVHQGAALDADQAQLETQYSRGQHPPPFPSSALHTLDPLVEVVSVPKYRKGLKRLYIEWGLKNRDVDAEGKLRDACEEAGIEFYNGVDW